MKNNELESLGLEKFDSHKAYLNKNKEKYRLANKIIKKIREYLKKDADERKHLKSGNKIVIHIEALDGAMSEIQEAFKLVSEEFLLLNYESSINEFKIIVDYKNKPLPPTSYEVNIIPIIKCDTTRK